MSDREAKKRLEAADQPIDIKGLGVQRLLPRKGEKVLDQALAAFGRVLHRLGQTPKPRLLRDLRAQQIEVADDDL